MHLFSIPQQVNDIYSTIIPRPTDTLSQGVQVSVLYLVCLNFWRHIRQPHFIFLASKKQSAWLDFHLSWNIVTILELHNHLFLFFFFLNCIHHLIHPTILKAFSQKEPAEAKSCLVWKLHIQSKTHFWKFQLNSQKISALQSIYAITLCTAWLDKWGEITWYDELRSPSHLSLNLHSCVFPI